jgi:hypothetical protein
MGWDAMFKKHDDDGNGELDQQEFISAVRAKRGPPSFCALLAFIGGAFRGRLLIPGTCCLAGACGVPEA